jgi:hypothetical protein
MPYLDRDWMLDSGEFLSAGTWIPETNWDRWQSRGVGRPLRLAWCQESGPDQTQRMEFERLNEAVQMEYLGVLGRDIGSVQRDGLFYSNFVESLKNSPTNLVADEVVDRMQMLGFASASWPFPVGGPPPHESPRPWKRVLDWLLKLLAKAGKFLLNCVEFAMVTLRPLGASAVAVGVAWPLSVSFEFPPELFQDPQGLGWSKARTVLDNIIAEMAERAFAP